MTNPFEVFKSEFTRDLGLDPIEYPAEYINYVNTRVLTGLSLNISQLNDNLKNLNALYLMYQK